MKVNWNRQGTESFASVLIAGIAKEHADGIKGAKEMTISQSATTFMPFGEPFDKVQDLKLTKTKVACKVKYSKKGWDNFRLSLEQRTVNLSCRLMSYRRTWKRSGQ